MIWSIELDPESLREQALNDGDSGGSSRRVGDVPANSRSDMVDKVASLACDFVRCLNDVRNCSVTCKVGELKEHVLACLGDEVTCSQCGEGVRRGTAAAHLRRCISSASSTNQSVSSTNVPDDVARMKRHLEKLRELVSTEVVEKDAVVSGVNSVAEEASRLETRLIALAKENAYLKGPSLASYIAPGPYRSASARGTAITLCKLRKVGSMRCSSVESELYTLLGYTFRVWCERNTETTRLLIASTSYSAGVFGQLLGLAFLEAYSVGNTAY
ncbi:hypothetical protein MRX96_058935 [Rhipicephalus microplus]